MEICGLWLGTKVKKEIATENLYLLTAMHETAAFYQQRIGHYQMQQDQLRRKLRIIPWSRLGLFALVILGVLLFTNNGEIIYIIASIAFFAGFLAAGLYDFRVKRKIRDLEILEKINLQEIEAIGGDYTAFEPGIEFANEGHPYTHDLDIFGHGSLFQYVNRTSTIYGKQRLAEYFDHAFQFRNDIAVRQQAVRELASRVEFRQQLQSIFHGKNTLEQDLVALTAWLDAGLSSSEDQPGEKQNTGAKSNGRAHAEDHNYSWPLMKTVVYIGPFITLSCLFAAIGGLIPPQVPVFLIFMQLLVVFGYGRQTQQVHQTISSRVEILRKYAEALTLIEATVFQEDLNKRFQHDLLYHEMESPGRVIKRFSNLLKWMDSNLNIVISVILNGLLMFNIHLLIAVEAWRNQYREMIPKWFAILAEFDALSSLATFSFNNPDYIFPEQTSGGYKLVAAGIGHPLIPRDRCVKNDFEIHGWNQFSIITGANMSGKSTFLRTIGTNYILAMMGAPVFAEKFIFCPVEIHSSIRTNDSLVKRESYFYAELKRLKEIIDELEQGRQKFILLDEILKGTNSSDKQTGSIALIRQLLNYNAIGLFATHDLALGKLIDTYPDHITNHCFEIMIDKDRMEIDYKLRPGVCKNLNASYLMKKMGILFE